jgi:2-polyprenyl-3-methyl-5-hydroxy-6-metoxy-1,4-benzoquinol methylase
VQLIECRVCRSNELKRIFTLPDLPLAGDFKNDRLTEDEKFPLDLLFCEGCKVVQIDQTIELNRLFNTYAFSSSTVPSLVEHFEEYANWLVNKVNPKSVLEIGCNDGILLYPLSHKGIQVFGVDMSNNIGDIARSRGLDVKSIKFGSEQMQLLEDWVGSVDLITASNAFPHNDDPNGFLSTTKNLLSNAGHLALEVMYAGSLKTELQWDTVYHEHLHIHSLQSLKNLLEINGFSLVSAEIVAMHAGSLRIIARPGIHSLDERASQILQQEEESGLNTLKSWLDFEEDSLASIKRCESELTKIAEQARVWAYGASGRASMWLNASKLNFIEKVVDASPLRAGRYMPGISTPIVLPEEFDRDEPDYTLITAWNYADRIMAQHPNYKGKWIIPLPSFKIL